MKLTDEQMAMVNKTVEMARKNLEEHGELLPMLIGTNSKTKQTSIVGMDLRDEESKDKIAHMVKKMVKELGIDFVVCVMESWSVSQEKAQEFLDGQKAGKWRSVSECPLKEEVVFFNVETKYGTWFISAPIIEKDKKKTIAETSAPQKVDSSQGRLANFINLKLILQ